MAASNVDLPLPEGPTSAVTRAEAKRAEKPEKTVVAPKRIAAPMTSICTGVSPGPASSAFGEHVVGKGERVPRDALVDQVGIDVHRAQHSHRGFEGRQWNGAPVAVALIMEQALSPRAGHVHGSTGHHTAYLRLGQAEEPTGVLLGPASPTRTTRRDLRRAIGDSLAQSGV